MLYTCVGITAVFIVGGVLWDLLHKCSLIKNKGLNSAQQILLAIQTSITLRAEPSVVLRGGERDALIVSIRIYQISEYQFLRVLIGSRNSEYPWLFTVLRPEPRWRLVLRHFGKTEFER